MGTGTQKKLKTAIIVLTVLLFVSLAALAAVLIQDYISAKYSKRAIVPDNILNDSTNSSHIDHTGISAEGSQGAPPTAAVYASALDGAYLLLPGGSPVPARDEVVATTLTLFNLNPGDNAPFQVGNMFPGDAVTQYYRVRVCHSQSVILRFNADIHTGGELLAEVLKCRIDLPEAGLTLYDGLMKDMPDALEHPLPAEGNTTDDVYYEITAYLDTSVDNAYMRLSLTADFNWWVEEGLAPPHTDGAPAVLPWVLMAVAVTSLILIILLRKRLREGCEDDA